MTSTALLPAGGMSMGHVAALRRLLDEYGAPFGGHVHCDLVVGCREG